MNKFLIGSFLSIAIMFFFVNVSLSKQLNSAIKVNGSDSLMIIQLENNWSKALVNHDVEIFKKYLSDDLVYTENENLYTRGQVMESLLSTAETIEESYNEDMQVRIYGNTAIATGFLYINGKGANGNFKRKYRYTDIWMNRNGDWQLVAAQDYLFP